MMTDYEMFHLRLKRLQSLKEFMTEDEYRFAFARIQAKYLVTLFKSKGKTYTRKLILNRVNIRLRENHLKTVSYKMIENAIG